MKRELNGFVHKLLAERNLIHVFNSSLIQILEFMKMKVLQSYKLNLLLTLPRACGNEQSRKYCPQSQTLQIQCVMYIDFFRDLLNIRIYLK